jgi:hypothetical protein
VRGPTDGGKRCWCKRACCNSYNMATAFRSYPPAGWSKSQESRVAFGRVCNEHLGFDSSEQHELEIGAIFDPDAKRKANLRLSVFHFLPGHVHFKKTYSTIVHNGVTGHPRAPEADVRARTAAMQQDGLTVMGALQLDLHARVLPVDRAQTRERDGRLAGPALRARG